MKFLFKEIIKVCKESKIRKYIVILFLNMFFINIINLFLRISLLYAISSTLLLLELILSIWDYNHPICKGLHGICVCNHKRHKRKDMINDWCCKDCYDNYNVIKELEK